MKIIRHLVLDWLGQRKDNLGWRAVAPVPKWAPVTRILLLQLDGKLGDSVHLSAMLKPIRERFPAGTISVATTPDFGRYWSSNPLVHRVIIIPRRSEARFRLWRLWRTLHRERGQFDVCVLFEPFLTFDSLLGVRAVDAGVNIGFAKQHYQLFDISLHDHTFHWRKRLIDSRVRELLGVFGAAEDVELQGYTGIGDEGGAAAERILSPRSELRVFLNAFGTASESCFDQSHLLEIIRGLFAGDFGQDIAVFLNLPTSYPPHLVAELGSLANVSKRVVRLPSPLEMSVLFAVIARMQLVISPDTGIVHVAAAMDIPQVALYPERAFKGTVWRAQSARACVLVPESEVSVNDVSVATILAGAREKLAVSGIVAMQR